MTHAKIYGSNTTSSIATAVPCFSQSMHDGQFVEMPDPTGEERNSNLEQSESARIPSKAKDVEVKSMEVNSNDPSEGKSVLPSESAENEDVSPDLPSPDSVDSEAREAPVDNEGLVTQVGHEVVEPTTSAEAADGSVEPESVSVPDDDVKEKPAEVNSEVSSEPYTVLPSESAEIEDVSPELPAEGSVDNVGSEALFAPVEEVHEVVQATISAEPGEGSAEPESGSVLSDDVEDKSVEVDSGDVSEAITALESADNEVAGSELPTEESAENVSSEALEPEVVHEVVESATSAESIEEATEPESVSAPDHVEDRSLEGNVKDTSEAATVLPSESADNEVVSSEPPTDDIFIQNC